MSYGSPVLRQHVVEFIVGTGVVIDGVTDNNYGGGGTSGPWTWVVPTGVVNISIDGCGGGGGGGGGYNLTVSRAGGGGGASGISVKWYIATCYASSSLLITVGAGGAGGAAAAQGSDGGSTTISGLAPQSYATTTIRQPGTTGGTFAILGGGFGSRAQATVSGSGGISGANNGTLGYSSASGGGGVTNAATPTQGNLGTENAAVQSAYGAYVYAQGGQSGGAASTVGTTAGANGRSWLGTGGRYLSSGWNFNGGIAGNTDTTNSYGGGGSGSPSVYGAPGNGGIGNSVGLNATGFGAGGGGGGGNAAGGSGSPGYVCFTYWSQD